MMMKWIVLGLLMTGIPPASAMDYKQWAQATETYKRAYVFGIVEYMAGVASPADPQALPRAKAYTECLKGSTDELLAKQAEAYVARNPTAFTDSMVGVVLKAMQEICRPKIDDELLKAGLK